MSVSEWEIKEEKYIKQNIELNGSRFLIGNGYMGYRGTLEEYTSEQLVALNMAGLFDKNGDLWRESVNAPNPFYTVCSVGGKELNPLTCDVIFHDQTLNLHSGVHSRTTDFKVKNTVITVSAQRFLSMKNENLAVLKYTVSANKKTEITVKTKIDTKVWSINGEHFSLESDENENNVNILKLKTLENGIPMRVYEYINGAENENTVILKPDESFSFVKVCGIYWGDSCETSLEAFTAICGKSYNELEKQHIAEWDKIWEKSDVVIEGDTEAQKAIRYSIYQLSSIAPRNTDACGIPARGLSGQVYKGAAFWDTEMFMLPFFSFTDEKVARNLVRYRINTIDGAKRKAKEFGYEGAFYAWESQETGDDACTLFNVTDIFTNRPLRTYFKDKQIHVSADMVFAMWDYCRTTGDYSVLRDGGLNLMYECVWFFYTYSSFRAYKSRYELLDVVGPDEYHERVDNNAFTNQMVAHAAKIFLAAIKKTETLYPEQYSEFIKNKKLDWAYDFADKIYVPQPDEKGLIEQFDGYMKMEDIYPQELKKRELKENEYWGCHGLASTTRVLKQADVIMMLNVFRNEYSREVKQSNWDFYEPYTEHGSSLSACAYAIVAAEIGYTDWAYKYFMKTATVDLTGNTKQYLGSLYIGGTHPAANGGSWNTAVFGFGGVSHEDDTIDISPRLPKHWNKLQFKLLWKGVRLSVTVTNNGVTIISDGNTDSINVTVNKQKYEFKG